MRYTKAIFRNWTGIYLGLGLKELTLDLSKSKNRICLIYGSNGSSKTTIAEGLTLFSDIYSNVRDSNDFILTDENGEKDGYRELHCAHNGVTYISKIHWLTDKTKCFLFRIDENGVTTDLNPNGNVRSYEEQLEIFLGLTKSHNKLLFLGSGMQDVISMIPSTRKGYISTFTPNINKYLELHKTTTKYYSKLKNDINVVVSEIHKLGDDRTHIELNRDTSKERMALTTEKLQFLRNVESNAVNTMRALSINGISIIDLYKQKVQYHNDLCIRLNQSNIIYKNLLAKYSFTSNDEIQPKIVAQQEMVSRIKFQSESFNVRYQELTDNLRSLTLTRASRQNILDEYVRNNNPDKFIQEQSALNDELNEINTTLQSIVDEIPELCDINQVLFTKEDSTKYIIFIDSVMTKISDIQSRYEDMRILEKFLHDQLDGNSDESEYLKLKLDVEKHEKELAKLQADLGEYEQSKLLADLLENIPANCANPKCPFINEARKFTKTHKNVATIHATITDLIATIDRKTSRLQFLDEYTRNVMEFLKSIRELSKFIDGYTDLIAKFPDFQNLTDIKLLFKNIVFLLPHARRYSEYAYIHDRYNDIIGRLTSIEASIHSSTSYFETVESMESELKYMDARIDKIRQDTQQLYNDNKSISETLASASTILVDLQSIHRLRAEIVQDLIQHARSRSTLKSLRKHHYCGIILDKRLTELRDKIQFTISELDQQTAEYSNSEYNLRRYDDFTIRRDDLEKEFEVLEVLRKCWSPTTGIPLIFIEGFMNKLLSDANEYLREIWEDQGFLIREFGIDEKNFYISIDRGAYGYVCKDASQCSGAERAMLCTVLSLALLKRIPNCEDQFNITKFDEIDSSLDYEKKDRFLGILNGLLDGIHAEQTFMISHSDVFQSDVDVILLRNGELYKSRLLSGNYNIIYQY